MLKTTVVLLGWLLATGSVVAQESENRERGNQALDYQDPWEGVFREAVAALDQSCDRWNERPSEKLNVQVFIANFMDSISHGRKRFVTGRMVQEADRNTDGLFDRSEAKLFLRQQLGLHCNGVSLRTEQGKLLRFTDFLTRDLDRRGWLSIGEYTDRRQFARDDTNKDTLVTLDEFAATGTDPNGNPTEAELTEPDLTEAEQKRWFDLPGFFRQADSDLSGTLNQAELKAASSEANEHLVASTFTGFDQDNDGELTIDEYALSMHGCVNYFWSSRLVDTDGDGVLGFEEFVFHEIDQFQLQRFYFFHRLDRDGDGHLSNQEFDFRLRP